jgi:hypothetical protein
VPRVDLAPGGAYHHAARHGCGTGDRQRWKRFEDMKKDWRGRT